MPSAELLRSEPTQAELDAQKQIELNTLREAFSRLPTHMVKAGETVEDDCAICGGGAAGAEAEAGGSQQTGGNRAPGGQNQNQFGDEGEDEGQGQGQGKGKGRLLWRRRLLTSTAAAGQPGLTGRGGYL